MKKIYLDNSMTTRPSDRVVSGMQPFFTEKWGSPAAPHQMGQQLFPDLKEAYQALYDILGAKRSDTIVFTSSGVEAVNHAILSGYLDITLPTGKNHFLTSNIDEAASLMAMERLSELGCVAKTIKAGTNGSITIEALGDAITPRTAMVSLSWANALTGVIQPVEEIAALCKERGIRLHLDATHILGKLYFEPNADLISFNGDHLHGPKGTGALYIKSGVKCSPLLVGGMEQAGYRGGPFNVPGLVGLGIAAVEALECRDLLCMEVARLRDLLEEKVLAGCPEATIFFRDQERLPNITSIGFPEIVNEALLFLLGRKGIYASIGGGSFQQIGLILMASGVKEPLAHSAVNFTLSRETTEEEIERAATIIVESAQALRKISANI